MDRIVREARMALRWLHHLIDHDELRHDPVLATLAGKLVARRSNCAPLAGKSTLNRLELSGTEPTRYGKLTADTAAVEELFVDIFLDVPPIPGQRHAGCASVGALRPSGLARLGLTPPEPRPCGDRQISGVE
jgi:hypothetical protein